MAYKCPRCGGPVQRATSTSSQVAAGLFGALLYAAFGSLQCKNCGRLRRQEFSPEDRQRMMLGSISLVVGAVLVIVALIAFLAFLGNS